MRWCYLGGRRIVSFRRDVEFSVGLPGRLGDVALQPRVPVVPRPPGNASRHQQTQFLTRDCLKGRRRRRRRRGRRRWSTVGQAAAAAAAERGPASRIQVDGAHGTRDGLNSRHTYTTRRVSRAHLANCNARISKSRLNNSGSPAVPPGFARRRSGIDIRFTGRTSRIRCWSYNFP